MGKLNDLGLKYGTDKSTKYHGYLDFYEEIFNEIREDRQYGQTIFCEIGVLGGASMKMWVEYFKTGHLSLLPDVLVGIDNVPMQPIDGCLLTTVDAYSPNGLEYIHALNPDIILDDGSHKSKDIITLVDFLLTEISTFPSLFIYEDCHASFWEDYTPKGERSAYEYCLDTFSDPAFDVRIFKKHGDLRDSVTMAVIKK